MKNKKLEDLVRYEASQEEDEEEQYRSYVDYDFAYDMNVNMTTMNLTTANALNETQSDFCVELNNDNKFYGMSHFDEASRAGFGLEDNILSRSSKLNQFQDQFQSQGQGEDKMNMNMISGNKMKNSSKINNLNNSKNLNITNTKKNTNTTITNNTINPNNTLVYDTNFSNLNQNFNFNGDSEIEKIDFDRVGLDVNRMDSLLDNREIFKNHTQNQHQHQNQNLENEKKNFNDQNDENYQNDKILKIKENNSPLPIKINKPSNNKQQLQEIKSAVNLTKDTKEMQLKKVGKNVSKSIEDYDYDKVNLHSISNDETLNLLKQNKALNQNKGNICIIKEETTPKKEKFNLDKYKVPNKYDYFEASEDFEVELETQSEQVTDFKKSIMQKKERNNKSINSQNYDDIDVNDEIEIEYLNKLKELQLENNELKMKLKEKNSNIEVSQSLNQLSNSENENENRKLREELEETKMRVRINILNFFKYLVREKKQRMYRLQKQI
jgi:hypothetical protein